MSELAERWPINPHEVGEARANDRATIVGMTVCAFETRARFGTVQACERLRLGGKMLHSPSL